MSHYVFGSGNLYASPVGGGAPLKFGTLQDVSVEISADIKQLYGQLQYPVDVARGKAKITCKATTGEINAANLGQVFFGNGQVATGSQVNVDTEANVIPAVSPYHVTVTNAANFTLDNGVYYAVSGLPLKQVVAGSEAVGKYSVSAGGIYTFSAADEGLGVVMSYIYANAAVGSTISITNALMGNTPKFQVVLTETYNSQFMTFVLYACVADKTNFPFKNDDYSINEIDWQAFANSAGSIGYISVSS